VEPRLRRNRAIHEVLLEPSLESLLRRGGEVLCRAAFIFRVYFAVESSGE
jgi:hypothetical protein